MAACMPMTDSASVGQHLLRLFQPFPNWRASRQRQGMQPGETSLAVALVMAECFSLSNAKTSLFGFSKRILELSGWTRLLPLTHPRRFRMNGSYEDGLQQL